MKDFFQTFRRQAVALPVRLSVLVPIVATVSLGVGLSGPFGTFDLMAVWERLIYWATAIVLAVALFHVLIVLAATVLPRVSRATQLLVVACPVFVAVYAPSVHVVNDAMLSALPVVQATTLVDKVLLVTIMAYGVCTSIILFAPEFRRGPGPAFLERLPAHLGRDVVRVQAADRQIEVVTRVGRAQVPMRLSDALEELEALDGTQVHRAHWIAWDAVQEPVRLDGKLFLSMADGAYVPVSRARRDIVEERGFMFPVGEPGRPARARQS